MKALVVYDSQYGNTEKIAQAIGQALGSPPDVQVLRVGDTAADLPSGLTLLIVGSPTQKFRPLPTISAFLNAVPGSSLKGVAVAAFDTRYTEQAIDSIGILSFFVKIFGYAAKRIAARLEKKGGKLIVPPEGFYVGGTEGPVLDGELERAAAWARQIAGASRA